MVRWPVPPSSRAPEHELADFAELLCWQQGSTSATHLTQSLGRLAENDYSGGVPEEDEIPKDIEGAFQEIERRIEACSGGYPFSLDDKGNALHAIDNTDDNKYIVYKYLLLATRLNMGTSKGNHRLQARIDGTQLFERLSAEICREYFGDHAESMVFGTAAGKANFPGKVKELCDRIKEGDGYASRSANRRNLKDGKLDVVVWKPFSDGLLGKFIAFGQCKTGTTYKNTLTQLKPDSFCKKYMQSPLALSPLRMFFIAEALRHGDWYDAVCDAGLLFDRCRIVDFSKKVSKKVLGETELWTTTAAKKAKLSTP